MVAPLFSLDYSAFSPKKPPGSILARMTPYFLIILKGSTGSESFWSAFELTSVKVSDCSSILGSGSLSSSACLEVSELDVGGTNTLYLFLIFRVIGCLSSLWIKREFFLILDLLFLYSERIEAGELGLEGAWVLTFNCSLIEKVDYLRSFVTAPF